MVHPYPDPLINDTADVMRYANNVTEGATMLLLAISAWIILFVTLKGKGYRTSDSLLTASFLSFVLTSILFMIDLMTTKFVIMFFIFTFASFIYRMWDD